MASELDMKASTSSGLSSEATQRHSHKDNSTEDTPKQSDNQRHSKHRNKNKNKKTPKPPYKPAYLDVIQLEIDKLKQETRRSYEIQARQNAANEPAELDDEEQALLNNRLVTSAMIDKMEDLKLKLGSKDMIRRAVDAYQVQREHKPVNVSEYLKTHDHLVTRFQQETMTLLHLFYIVRLAQKGFFTFISQTYPAVDPDALIYLCDKLVGGSLFVVKDPVEAVRSSKKEEVFDLLHKLHICAPEPIGDGYSTTFEQVQALIHDFIGSAAPSSSAPEPSDQQPPIWLVVPFDGMAGGTTQSKTAPVATSERKNEPKKNLRKKGDSKNTPKSGLGDRTNDTNSVASNVTHNTELTGQANGSVTHELDQEDLADNYSESTSNPESVAKRQLQATISTHFTDNTSTHDAPLDSNGPSVEPTIDGTVGETITGVSTATDSTSSAKADLEENVSSGSRSPLTTEAAASPWTQESQQHDEIITTPTEDKKAENQESSTGWGDAPATETASLSWTQGLVDQQEPERKQDVSNIDITATEDKITTDGEASTGWGNASETTASSSWAQDPTEQQQQGDTQQISGWGSPVTEDTTPPAWEGKLPDDLVTPGDETISGDVADSKWQTVEFDSRRPMGDGSSGRGRGSGFRGGRYRSFNDGGRGGMRRGGSSSSSGWNSRPNRT